jgi:hypothetical protein
MLFQQFSFLVQGFFLVQGGQLLVQVDEFFLEDLGPLLELIWSYAEFSGRFVISTLGVNSDFALQFLYFSSIASRETGTAGSGLSFSARLWQGSDSNMAVSIEINKR